MKTRVLKVGNARLAFGLSWSTLRGVGKQGQEVRALVKESKAEQLTIIKQEGVGTIVGLAGKHRGPKGTALSAAALFAALVGREDAMFLYRLAEGECIFIGIQGGMPAPGYDMIGTPEEAAALAEEFTSLREDNRVNLFGNVEFLESPTPIELDELLQVDRAALKRATLRAAKPPVKQIVAVLLVAGLAAGGMNYYKQWEQEQQRKAAAQKAPVDPNVVYQQNVAIMLVSTGYKASDSAQAYFDAINPIPMFHAGWALQKVVCVPGSCDTYWGLKDGGSFSSFEEKLPELGGIQNVVYGPDLNTIKGTYVFQIPDAARGQKQEVMPRKDTHDMMMDSFIQTAKVPELTFERNKKAQPSIFALPPNVQPGQIKNPITEGVWGMTGEYYQRDLLKILPHNLTLDSLSLAISDQKMTLTAEGKYYVKN